MMKGIGLKTTIFLHYRYLSIGVPILIYNVFKAVLLFRSAHKVKRRANRKAKNDLMNQNHPRPQYIMPIAISKPNFGVDSRNIGGQPRYYKEFIYTLYHPKSESSLSKPKNFTTVKSPYLKLDGAV